MVEHNESTNFISQGYHICAYSTEHMFSSFFNTTSNLAMRESSETYSAYNYTSFTGPILMLLSLMIQKNRSYSERQLCKIATLG